MAVSLEIFFKDISNSYSIANDIGDFHRNNNLPLWTPFNCKVSLFGFIYSVRVYFLMSVLIGTNAGGRPISGSFAKKYFDWC